jgi:hypothetical protein
MSDGKINDESREVGGYAPQGSTEIVAPGALRSVASKRKRRKKLSTELLPACGGQTALWYTLDRDQRTEREVRNCPPKRVRSSSIEFSDACSDRPAYHVVW